MNSELLKAIKCEPLMNKLNAYLQRREVIKEYTLVCLSDLGVKLERVELENATLTLTFKDQESVEAFNENKDEHYLPRFRGLYLDAKRMIEKLGVDSNFHFSAIHTTTKPPKELHKRTLFYTRKPRPINMDLSNHTDFTRKVFAKMIQANNERYIKQNT